MKKLPAFIFLSLLLISTMIFLHPSLAFADVGPAGIPQLEYLFARVVCLTVPAAFIVLFIILLIAGFKFLTSGGEAKALQSASQTVTWGTLGILFLGLVWLILRLIEAFTGVEVTKFSLSIFPGVPQYIVSCWSPPPLPSSPANLLPTSGVSLKKDNSDTLMGKKVAKTAFGSLDTYGCNNPQSTIETLKTNSPRYPVFIPGRVPAPPNAIIVRAGYVDPATNRREVVYSVYLVPKIRERQIQYPALFEALPILSFSQKICTQELIDGRCLGPYTEYIRVYRKETIPYSQAYNLRYYRFPSDILKEFFGDFAASKYREEAVSLGDHTTLVDPGPVGPMMPAPYSWSNSSITQQPLYPYVVACISPETIIFKISTP